jgi:hypothetical protein
MSDASLEKQSIFALQITGSSFILYLPHLIASYPQAVFTTVVGVDNVSVFKIGGANDIPSKHLAKRIYTYTAQASLYVPFAPMFTFEKLAIAQDV